MASHIPVSTRVIFDQSSILIAHSHFSGFYNPPFVALIEPRCPLFYPTITIPSHPILQTRRSTRTTRGTALPGDENANPPTTRSRVTKAIGGSATAATTASLAKRAAITRVVGTSKSVTSGLDKGKAKVEDAVTIATRKRAALGEVGTNKSSNHIPTLTAGKVDKEAEKKVVVQGRPAITRRPTRSSTAAAENAEVKQQVEARPAPRRRAPTVAVEDVAPIASTSRPRIAVKPSIARNPIETSRPSTKRSHPPPEADEVKHDEVEEDGIYEPASKRIRTSDAVVPEIDQLDNAGVEVEIECWEIPLANTRTGNPPPPPRAELGGPDVFQDWNDLDAEDIKDPQMVTEYVHDILKYMKVLEVGAF
jgi:G2/mitotic-specific cyclin 2